MALNRLWKWHSFAGWELKQQGRVSPGSASAGNLIGELNFSLLCTYLWIIMKMTEVLSIWEFTNKFYWAGEFTNTESVNNEDWLSHLRTNKGKAHHSVWPCVTVMLKKWLGQDCGSRWKSAQWLSVYKHSFNGTGRLCYLIKTSFDLE